MSGDREFSIELCRLVIKIFDLQWPNSREKRGFSAHTAGQDPDKDQITTTALCLPSDKLAQEKLDFEPFFHFLCRFQTGSSHTFCPCTMRALHQVLHHQYCNDRPPRTFYALLIGESPFRLENRARVFFHFKSTTTCEDQQKRSTISAWFYAVRAVDK